MADWLSKEQRSRNMSSIRSSGTSLERRLAAALALKFPRRKIEREPRLPGRPDFYLPGAKIAVFVDGCFWHCCPKHGRAPEDNAPYWVAKLARNKARDRASSRALRSMGIRPVRIWEHDVRRRTDNYVLRMLERRVGRYVQSRRSETVAAEGAQTYGTRKRGSDR